MQVKALKPAKQWHKFKQAYFARFIFIHINKTAGSSVEKALNIRLEHRTAVEKIREIGRDRWNRKLTFTIVRNPWDKVVSHYHYRVKTNQTNLGDQPIEFREWVIRAYGNQDPALYDKPRMFMPQMQWICDDQSRILVNEILRFENLQADFDGLARKLGISSSLPHVKKSNRNSYRDYYCADTIKVVENWFRADINQFGYRF